MIKSTIREATIEDTQEIAQLSTQTFRNTFATADNTTDIDAYLRTAFTLQKISAELTDSKNTFLLAQTEDSKDLIGYAKLRVGQEEACVRASNPIEIERLYVDKAIIGQGIGKQLMQTCLNRAADGSHDTVWLGVWEHNQRAIRFYEKWHFAIVGSHPFQLGSDKQNDLIMRRAVV